MSSAGKSSIARTAGAKAIEEPKPAKPKTARNIPELPQIPRVSLSGKFAEDVTIIPGSYSSMVLSSGHLEDEQRFVLLPFIETTMQGLRQGEVPDGDLPAEMETIFSHTLPLENAIWLAFDLLHDFRNACERLETMVDGAIQFDGARMTHAVRFAELAAAEAARCAASLRRLNGQAGSDSVSD